MDPPKHNKHDLAPYNVGFHHLLMPLMARLHKQKRPRSVVCAVCYFTSTKRATSGTSLNRSGLLQNHTNAPVVLHSIRTETSINIMIFPKFFYIWYCFINSPGLENVLFKLTWLLLIFQNSGDPGSVLRSGRVAEVCILASPPVKSRWNPSRDSTLPVITSNIFFPHTKSGTSTNDCRFD